MDGKVTGVGGSIYISLWDTICHENILNELYRYSSGPSCSKLNKVVS